MSITKITQKTGVRYRARIRTERGKQVTKTFSRKVDAQAWEREQLRLRERPDLCLNPTVDTTLRQFASLWLESQKPPCLAPGSWANYESALRLHVLPWFGEDLLQELTLADWDDWWADFQDGGLSTRSLNHALVMVGTMYRWGMRRYQLTYNPRDHLATIRPGQQAYDYWDADEIGTFLASAEGSPTYALYVAAINTGMRRGELIGLQWDAVSFERRRISVRRSFCGRSLSLRETTKNRRHRVIPMGDTLSALLAERRLASRSVWVFGDEGKGALPVGTLRSRFQRACERAGVRRIRFHDLRHSYASHFVMNGGDIFTLQKLLGHADVTTTQLYAHLSPDHLQHAVGVVDFGGKKESADVLELSSVKKK